MEQKRPIDFNKTAVDVMFSQTDKMPMYSKIKAKRGIDIFGQWAVEATLKECRQIKDMKVVGALDPDNLTSQKNNYDLRAIKLVKEKNYGKLKARTCEYESPQQKYIPRGVVA